MQTPVHCHTEPVLNPLGNIQTMEIVVQYCVQATFKFSNNTKKKNIYVTLTVESVHCSSAPSRMLWISLGLWFPRQRRRQSSLAGNHHTLSLRKVLTEKTARVIACSIVASRLDYCNTVSSLDKLQGAQNNLERVVCRWSRFSSVAVCPRLPCSQGAPIYKTAHLTFDFKLRLPATATYALADLLKLRTSTRSLQSAGPAPLIVPWTLTALSPWRLAPSLWLQ